MLKSRSIRVAVNLCVIGVLLMPSGGMTVANAANCDSLASSEATCSGCGHCQVSKPEERCGCCKREHQESSQAAIAASTEGGCCHSQNPLQKTAAAGVHESPNRDLSKKNSPHEYEGVCLCASAPQPAVPPSPNRLTNEQLVKLLLLDVMGFAENDSAPPHFSMERFSVAPSFESRDSQRRLCVWRI